MPFAKIDVNRIHHNKHPDFLIPPSHDMMIVRIWWVPTCVKFNNHRSFMLYDSPGKGALHIEHLGSRIHIFAFKDRKPRIEPCQDIYIYIYIYLWIDEFAEAGSPARCDRLQPSRMVNIVSRGNRCAQELHKWMDEHVHIYIYRSRKGKDHTLFRAEQSVEQGGRGRKTRLLEEQGGRGRGVIHMRFVVQA